MKFTHENRTFVLTFRREHKEVQITRRNKFGETVFTKERSKYPYTTAKLEEIDTDGKTRIFLTEHTVGCDRFDIFSKEQGRIMAMRGMGEILSKPLRKALWDAYMGRFVKPRPKIVVSTETLALTKAGA